MSKELEDVPESKKLLYFVIFVKHRYKPVDMLLDFNRSYAPTERRSKLFS